VRLAHAAGAWLIEGTIQESVRRLGKKGLQEAGLEVEVAATVKS